MRLTAIEITGFKSFAKKTTLAFTVPVTGIVGPNGSGKSNVVESFRFVMGEQSIKSMRGKSGADLIFRGSGGAAKLARASVAITFDNTDKVFDAVPFESVTFMREIFADGTSKYTLNGTEIRLKQMAELLSAVNIGTSSHHIISQGEADGILRANPRERREILEDALGLKVYHQRIKESENKLAKSLDALKEVQSLRRELAPHLQFLKKQVEKAEKGKVLRDELQTVWTEYLQIEQQQLAREDARIVDAMELLFAQKAQKEAEFAALPEEVTTGNDSIAGEISALKQQLHGVEQRRRDIEQKSSRLGGMLEAQRRILQQVKTPPVAVTVDQSHTTVSFSHEEYQQLISQITAFIAEIRSTDDRAAVIETLERFDQMVVRLQHHQKQQHAEKQKQPTQQAVPVRELQEITDSLHDTALQVEVLEKELQSVAREEQQLRTTITEKEAVRELSLQDIRQSTARRYDIRAAITACESQLQILDIAKRAFLERKASYDAEVAEASFLFGVAFLRTVEQESVEVLDAEPVTVAILHDKKRAIDRLKIRVDEHAGIGTEVFQEYENTKERDEFLAREIIDIEASIRNLESVIVELKKILDDKFTTGIQVINERFGEFFKTMFGGGSAFLSITVERKRKRKGDESLEEEGESTEDDSDDRFFERGIEVHVNLPEKKVKDLQMLSGGERSLVSIALLFAVSQVNPPPFLVLDETDAALDEANSRKYGDMIERLAAYSQLIVVTHNRETMSRASVLYGVTLGGDGASKLLSIKFDEAVKVAK